MSFPKLSSETDYLQLDICGYSPVDALKRYQSYQKEIPVVLHGDWTKKGCSENQIESRLDDYINIIQLLQNETTVLGFTMHPPFRHKVPFQTFLDCCNQMERETGVEVWIENRSSSKIWLSIPKEIIEFSHQHVMTIDLAQLYISCGYSEKRLMETLGQLNQKHIRELHISNVKRTDKNTLVARKLNDGNLDMKKVLSFVSFVPYWTLEILGGVPTFETQREWLNGFHSSIL
jgi:hypothetical protein